MKHPFYKRALSYITDISLETTSSHYNPYLEVRLVNGRHQLVTRDAVYSFDDKYLNFARTFNRFDWNASNTKEVLLLGLGLGSVIYILEKVMGLRFDYTAVDIDPEICRLAQKYTLQHVSSYCEVFPQDGIRFLEHNQKPYDLIIMDIFQSAVIPQRYQSAAFLELMRESMKKEACILYNRMNITEEDKESNEAFDDIFSRIFPDYSKLYIKDNIVFVSDGRYIK